MIEFVQNIAVYMINFWSFISYTLTNQQRPSNQLKISSGHEWAIHRKRNAKSFRYMKRYFEGLKELQNKIR